MEKLQDEVEEANQNYTSALRRVGEAHASYVACQDPEEKERLRKEMDALMKEASEIEEKNRTLW